MKFKPVNLLTTRVQMVFIENYIYMRVNARQSE